MSVVLALQNLRKGHKRIPCSKNDAPAKSCGTWLKFYFSSRIWIKLRFILLLKQGQCRPPQMPEESEVVDSGASMHMLSKRDLSSDEDTLKRSRHPTVVMTAKGKCNHSRRDVCSRSWFIRDEATNSNSHLQMVQQKCQEETANSENPTRSREYTARSEHLRGEFQGEPEESQPTELKDDAEARTDFWSIQGDFISRHHNETRIQLHVLKEETFPEII